MSSLDAWLKARGAGADAPAMGCKLVNYLRGNTLALLALFVALGGTSYAAAGGLVAHNGQLAGCVGSDGVLKVLKPGHRCRKGQTAVAWNVAGQAGSKAPAGATGAPGAKGDAGNSGQSIVGSLGPVGPSDAYTSKSHGSPISLPAGDYTLFGKARWRNGQKAETRELFCELSDSSGLIDQEAAEVPAGDHATLVLGGPVRLETADKVSMVCSVEEGSVELVELTAIRVGTLHEQ
jgi:hypothetical protein